MKIVLVNPPIKYSLSPLPPLGIAYIAAFVRKNGYPNITIIDGAAEALAPDTIVDRIAAANPDVVGFSVMSNVQHMARDLSCRVRQRLDKTIICWGGAHASAMPEHSLSSGFVDVVFRHEAEYSFLEFIRLLDQGKEYHGINGICFLKDGKTICNPQVPRISNLDSLPFPARDLLPMNRYATSSWFSSKVKKGTTIIGSRGCPYECTYCANKVCWGNRQYIRRDPVKIVDEMEVLIKEYGINGFQFSDECLTANRNHALRFCGELLSRRIDVAWVCSSTVKNVDAEVLGQMKKAGCEFINYGIESGSPAIREKIKKRISDDEIYTAVNLAKKAGLRVGCCFLLGCPGETLQTARQTIKMAQRLAPDDVAFNIVVPFPGTELFETLVLPKGINLNWDEAMGFDPLHPDTPKIFYNCSDIPDRELISLYREARRKVELNIFAFRMMLNRLIHVSGPRHLFIVLKGGLKLLFKR
jgi:radical SAM superfamily enzyme YgiQ (UPF0313 family)